MKRINDWIVALAAMGLVLAIALSMIACEPLVEGDDGDNITINMPTNTATDATLVTPGTTITVRAGDNANIAVGDGNTITSAPATPAAGEE
jgi:hypothetical protein